MKIDPSNPTSFSTTNHFTPKVTSIEPSISTLQSMQRSAPIQNLWEKILACLRWLFCLPPLPKQNPAPKQTSSIAVDVARIEQNPFLCFVHNKDGTIKNKKSYDAAVSLYSLLGFHSLAGWVQHKDELLFYKNQLVTLQPHPLEFLYHLLAEKETAKSLFSFKQNTCPNLSYFNPVRAITDPWPEFVQKNSKNFQRFKQTLPTLLSGFCEALDLEKEPIDKLAREEKWESLILLIIDKRKKHFNI